MATPSLDDLTNCSICLETFTRPKVLPCQHTYCYSCLLSIGKYQTTITCPQCREECHIPEDGIANFRDSVVINNLLALCGAQKDNLCTDCKVNSVVAPCSHCNTKVCAPCFSEHIKLSTQLNMTLEEMKDKVSPKLSDEKNEKLQRSRADCEKQLQDMKKFHRRKLMELFKMSRSSVKFMEKICRVHDDILQTSETMVPDPFSTLTDKAGQCKTIESLKSLQNDVSSFKTVVRVLDQDSEDHFRFVPNNTGSDALGHIEIDQSAVAVQTKYESEFSIEDLKELMTEVDSEPSTSESTTSQDGESYRQNQLPRNVDYFNKGFFAIGSDEQPNNLFKGAAHRAATGDIYVADKTNNQIMLYSSDDKDTHVFYEVPSPYDVAISTDDEFIYIAASGQLIKVDTDGEEVQIMETCSLGSFNGCLAVVCHREFTFLVDSELGCVIIFDEYGKELRHFGRKNLRDPTALAISDNGEMFITNDTDRSIEVFNWNGEFVETFLRGEDTHSYGEAAVDGDGYIYVTNRMTNTIDVYNRQKDMITTISGPGKLPGQLSNPIRLSLTPDGRIIVSDRVGGGRLQIF